MSKSWANTTNFVDKTEIKRLVSKLDGFDQNRAEMEQYLTPPELCGTIAQHLKLSDRDNKVSDLGAGTGYLSVASALAGRKVEAVEKDSDAVEILQDNLKTMNLEDRVSVRNIDVVNHNPCPTAVMNPPFSVHSNELERFLETSLGADRIYALTPSDFDLKSWAQSKNRTIIGLEDFTISLGPEMSFHSEERYRTDVSLGIVGM